MNLHVPSQGGQTQLGWLFHMIDIQLVVLRTGAERLPAGNERTCLLTGLRNLAIAADTATVAACNFESAVQGVMEVIAQDGCVTAPAAETLLAPLREELGDMYVDFELARAAQRVA